ncbi:hypothetical protein GCM10010197_45500 [Nocardioides luteus]|uniref:Uncharacterized protein n=2 Tax=Nocardioides luteus TaxID=1844 RepID=A0ABQ5SSW3_9ACTN|nr:hypothetical protein GCM10010197_45500 [Nocardioides luteus]GLJ67243.1 hypothetical protein GCM10017579_12790 [Nocardioides luteus]
MAIPAGRRLVRVRVWGLWRARAFVTIASMTTDEEHTRPDGVDDLTVEALGSISEALEAIEIARGHLYSLHRITGTADLTLGKGVEQLREAGHTELADKFERELVGRNVLFGRWTFQIVEEYDDGYYGTFKRLEKEARDTLVEGKRHLFESEMKEDRRTQGQSGHEHRPDSER